MAQLSRFRRQRGLAAVEMALVLPLLLLLLFALIEFGWVFLKQEEVTNAARHGARLAITPDATSAKVQAGISTLMAQAGLGSSGYTVTLTPGDVSSLSPGQTLTVKVSLAYSNVALLGLTFIPAPSTLHSTVTMAKEGP